MSNNLYVVQEIYTKSKFYLWAQVSRPRFMNIFGMLKKMYTVYNIFKSILSNLKVLKLELYYQ